LIEVMLSILVVTTIILAALASRYLSVRQARRGDAYNMAGNLGLLLVEGWRSTEPTLYNPTALLGSFNPHMTVTSGATGCPAAPGGFTTLNTYRVVLDNMNFYVRLAYANPDLTVGAEHPAQLHAGVTFRNHYEAGDASTSSNYVGLTTYR